MANYQTEMWPAEIIQGYRMHSNLLAKGEKPDMRPWGGLFENPAIREERLRVAPLGTNVVDADTLTE